MKIYIKDRYWINNILNKKPDFYMGKEIISIYSSGDTSPFIDRFNILKLNFDDIVYPEVLSEKELNEVILFDEDMAKQIVEFAQKMNPNKLCFIHCDAGISRSGAVGYVLNEYFNKKLENNETDFNFFKNENKHILPNDLVVKILKKSFEPLYYKLWKDANNG